MNSVAECRRFRVFRQPKLQSLLRSVFTEQTGDFIRSGGLLRDFGSHPKPRGRYFPCEPRRRDLSWYCLQRCQQFQRRFRLVILGVDVGAVCDEQLGVFLVPHEDGAE